MTGCLGEIFKTSSIVTGLLFSLQRLLETSEANSRRKSILLKMKPARTAFLIFTFSSFVSVSKILEYNSSLTVYDSSNPFRISLWFLKGHELQVAFYFSHYILNDFVFLLANLVIDFKLVLNIKMNLKAKITVKSNNCQSDSFKGTDIKKLKEDLKKKRSVEKKANALIISSVTVYFFCRIPELAGMIYFFFSDNFLLAGSCEYALACYLLYNVIEYLFMLSYISNIFFYYNFNSSFRKGFRIFFGIKKKTSHN